MMEQKNITEGLSALIFRDKGRLLDATERAVEPTDQGFKICGL
jgi:hypothetical protein